MNLEWDIRQVTYRMWRVDTPDRESQYYVWIDNGNWKCGCLTYLKDGSCPHIRKVWKYIGANKCQKNV